MPQDRMEKAIDPALYRRFRGNPHTEGPASATLSIHMVYSIFDKRPNHQPLISELRSLVSCVSCKAYHRHSPNNFDPAIKCVTQSHKDV